MSTRTWTDGGTYKIVRFYYRLRRPRTIKRGLTLQQAKDHCSRPDTRVEGVYFDGFDHDCCK